jgi:hypothetical protein
MTEPGWKDIETAPKDGEIDVWVRSFAVGPAGALSSSDVGRYTNVRWGVQREIYTDPYECREGETEGWLHKDELHELLIETGTYRVTHWMPLPEPPHAD